MTCCFIIIINKNIDRVGNISALEYTYNYFSAALYKENQVFNMFHIENKRRKKNKSSKIK